MDLAQADEVRRHFDQFVLVDIGDRLFERQPLGRRKLDGVVLAAGAEVGQRLRFQRVDFQIFVSRVFTNHHALVDGFAGLDHQNAARLEIAECIADRFTGFGRDQDAVAATRDIALVGAVFFEQSVHDAGAAGVRQELAMIADKAARRGREGQAGLAATAGSHIGHLGLAASHLLDDRARILFVDVDDDGFIWLGALAIFVDTVNDARTTDRQFEPFAAHRFDQHAQLQFTAPGDFKGILRRAFGDLDRDIAFGFALQAVRDHPAGNLGAIATGIGRIIDRKGHAQRWRIDRLCLQRLGDTDIGNRVGDGGLRKPGERDDIAGLGFIDRHAFEAAKCEDLRRAAFLDDLAVRVEGADLGVEAQRARQDAAGQDASDEIVAIKQRHQHFELTIDIGSRRRDMRYNRFEQWCEVARAHLRIAAGIAVASRGKDHREIELLVIGLQCDEQVEDFVEHFLGARIGAVDLVDDDNRAQAQSQSLAGNELCLRHRPFGGIDEQHDAIDHRQNAFDFAAEIGVSGSVDDVDVGGFVVGLVGPFDRRALGENGDAAFFFEIVRIHGAFGDALILAEGPRLPEQLVDKRGLAVVNVRDNRDIPQRHLISILWDGQSCRKDIKARASAAP